jgi:hypothetical protein
MTTSDRWWIDETFPDLLSLTHQMGAPLNPPSPPSDSPFPRFPANFLTNPYPRAILSRVSQPTSSAPPLRERRRSSLTLPSLRVSSFRLSTVDCQPLLLEPPRPSLPPANSGCLFLLFPRPCSRFNPFLLNHLHTLFPHGRIPTPLSSVTSALFPSQRRV